MEYVYALAALNGSIEYTITNKADLVHDNVLINVNTAAAAARAGVKDYSFPPRPAFIPENMQTKVNSSPKRGRCLSGISGQRIWLGKAFFRAGLPVL